MRQDTPQLTEQLLEDLLDPAMTPLLICQIHSLTLPQLTKIIQSEDYRAATAAIQTINAARTPTIESTLHLQSLSTLREAADLAHQAANAAANTLPPSPSLLGEGRGEGSQLSSPTPSKPSHSSSSSHLRAQTNAIESLRKSATTLHRTTRPSPKSGALLTRSLSRSSNQPQSPPRPNPSPKKSGTPFVISPLRVSGVHGGTRICRQRQRHELRDSDLSIRSTLLDPQARRTHRKPRKPWYRRL